jgi:hypothetical protein
MRLRFAQILALASTFLLLFLAVLFALVQNP